MTSITLQKPDWSFEEGTPPLPVIHRWQEGIRQVTRQWLRAKAPAKDWMQAYSTMCAELLVEVWNHTIPAEYRLGIEYIILGSSARGEDVFDSDLDHALLFTETVDTSLLNPHLYEFIQRMAAIGIPPCQGFVMGTNERWSGTIAEWQNRVDGYFNFPDWENVRYLFMMLDSRVFSGPSSDVQDDWEALRQSVQRRIAGSPYLCWEMAHLGIENTVTVVKPSLGRLNIFGNGSIHIKSGLLAPVLHSIRLLSVAHQIFEITTEGRLAGLVQAGAIDRDMMKQLLACLDYAWRTRIQQGIDNPRIGTEDNQPDQNEVLLFRMTASEREELAVHANTAKKLERMVHRQFRKPR